MYVDDRAICSSDVQQLQTCIQMWRDASRSLGLKENEAKTSYVCFSVAQRRSLERAGVDPKCIKEQIRVLGLDVVPTWWHESDTILKRCEEGLAILNRLAFCPIGREVRRALYRSRVMPLVTWGALLRPLPARVVKQVSQLYRSLSRGHPMGSKPLRTILEGHHADSSFLSLHQSVQAAQRAHKFRRLRWRNSPSPAGWQHALVRGLSEYGWTPQRNWILQHPQEGQCNILHDGAAVLHKVRESWRRSLFAEFLSQKRRDSNLLRQQVGYDHMSCKVARCLYESSGNHGRAVLVGAALSSAVYCRIRKEPVPFHCSWCNQQEAADWDHLVWHCPAFAGSRPASMPQSSMACRMAWPPRSYSKRSAEKLLHHMAAVREQAEQVMERLS